MAQAIQTEREGYSLAAAQRQRLIGMQDIPVVAVRIAIIVAVARPVSAVVVHGVVVDAHAIRMGMVA
jgi:hypothetical protein